MLIRTIMENEALQDEDYFEGLRSQASKLAFFKQLEFLFCPRVV